MFTVSWPLLLNCRSNDNNEKKKKKKAKEARQMVARIANEIQRRKTRRKATIKEKKILEKLKQKAQS